MIGFRRHGNGPVRAIFLHGWMSDGSIFDPVLDAIGTSVAEIALMDFRGYGLSRHEQGVHSIDEIAGDALALGDFLGWQTFHLVGHSMGCKAALNVAMKQPGRVQSIVAINPVHAGVTVFEPSALTTFEAAAGRLDVRSAIIDYSTGGRLPPAWSVALAGRSAETCGQQAFGDYFEAWSRTDFAEEARGLPHEILALVGEHDPAVTRNVVTETYLGQYPKARLEVLPNAGHYPMEETPPFLAAKILEFWKSRA